MNGLFPEALLRQLRAVGHQEVRYLARQLPREPVLEELPELRVIAQHSGLGRGGQVEARELVEQHRGLLLREPCEPRLGDRVEHRGAQQRPPDPRRQALEDLAAEVREQGILGGGQAGGPLGPAQRLEHDARRPSARRPPDGLGVTRGLAGLQQGVRLVEVERELGVEHAAQVAPQELVGQVEVGDAARDEHHEGVRRQPANEGPQGAEGLGLGLQMVEIVDHDRPVLAETLREQRGAVLGQHPVREQFLHHRLEAGLDRPDRRGQIADEAARRAVGGVHRQPGGLARASREESRRLGGLAGPRARHEQHHGVALGGAVQRGLHPRALDQDGGGRGRPELGRDLGADAHEVSGPRR